jgi:dienelactone hydrolase
MQGDYMRKLALFFVLFPFIIFSLSIHAQLELPAPNGTYAVGQMFLRWVDASRPEILTDDPNDVREVVAVIWYPAKPGSGVNKGYFPQLSTLSDEMIRSEEVKPWEVFGLRFFRSDHRFEASPLKVERPFPVVILSPGNGTNVEFCSALAGEISSHGYVVIGVNHPYDVPAVELSGGRVAPYNKEQWLLHPAAHQAYVAERIKVRIADALFVLENVEEMNTDGPFAGLLDLDSVAAAGHSLGGITASEACKADPRIHACLNFDGLQRGGPFSMEETAIPPEQPFLFLTKEARLHPGLIERFESTVESYWVVVHGAGHQSFTDGPLLRHSLLPAANQADEFMNVIQTYTLAFLDQTLKGEPSGLLSKTVHRKDVSVQAFPGE